MVKIDEINGSSTFAWSPDGVPLLATGTVAGAVDVNFDSSSTLEIWDLFSFEGEKKPLFSSVVDDRFYSLAWSKPFDDRSHGLLAGAYDNGTIEIWDAEILIKTKNIQASSVYKSSGNTGQVKVLSFNPNQSHILVTGGSNGKIFIFDTKTFAEPTTPGKAMTPMDEITSVAWNSSVSHIFATTGNGGYTSIWDLKTKREVLHLSYSGSNGKVNFSDVVWHPTQSTKLITASDDDNCPLILTWDLRNSNAPEKILEGHSKGVLSLDWCSQDPNLLLSSGKDNSTILWNPAKGIKLGEYPTAANWAFLVKFAIAAPDVFATASFDGKIVVQSLQDTSPPLTTKVSSNDDDSFWNEIATTETQQPIFDVVQAPVWLKNRSNVQFGFGSKLVVVGRGEDGKSFVDIKKCLLSSQNSSVKLSEAFKTDDFNSLITSKLTGHGLKKPDVEDWKLLQKLGDVGVKRLIEDHIKPDTAPDVNGTTKAENTEESFFEELGNGRATENYVPSGSFGLYDGATSENDKKLIKLVLSKKVDDAVVNCLDQKRLNEALVLALDASEEIKSRVKNAYFSKKKDDSLSRVLYSVSANNINDLIVNGDVSDWKDIVTAISSFSIDESDFSAKVNELGDRILASGDGKRGREEALACYLCGNGTDRITNIWFSELHSYEKALIENNGAVSSPSEAHFETLNNFVEKIATYRFVTSSTSVLSGPTIEPTAKAVLEYSNLVASFGDFELAERILSILPSSISSPEKERILKAMAPAAANRKEGSSTNQKSSGSRFAPAKVNARPLVPASRVESLQQSNATPGISSKSATTRQYPVATPFKSQHNIQPFPTAPVNNSHTRAVSQNPYAPPPVTANTYKPPTPVMSAAGPSVPSPSKSTPYTNQTEGWNDLPDTFKTHTAPPRRAAHVEVTRSPTPGFNNPQFANVPRRTSNTPGSERVVPPPPRGISRNNSKTSLSGHSQPNQPSVPEVPGPPRKPSVTNSSRPPIPSFSQSSDGRVTPRQHSVSSRYAPPARSNVGSPLLTHGAPSSTPGTPGSRLANVANGAINNGASNGAAKDAYDQAFSFGGSGSNLGVGSTSRMSAVPAPPKNPYAPPASDHTARIAPKPDVGPPARSGIAPPTQNFAQGLGPSKVFSPTPSAPTPPPPPPSQRAPSSSNRPAPVPFGMHGPPQGPPRSTASPIPAMTRPPPSTTTSRSTSRRTSRVASNVTPKSVVTESNPAEVESLPQTSIIQPPAMSRASALPIGRYASPVAVQQTASHPSGPPSAQQTSAPPSTTMTAIQQSAPPPLAPAEAKPSETTAVSTSSSNQGAPLKKYPDGDRSHIPDSSLPIYQSLGNVLSAIKPNIPEKYAKHGRDMEDRLNILFDHLNNNDLLTSDTLNMLKNVGSSLESRDFLTAASINLEIATKHGDEVGKWHTGVKRLITMAEVMF